MRNKIYTLTAIFIIALLYYFSISAFKKESGSIKTENVESMTSFTRDTFTNCIFNSSFQEVCGWGLGPQLHVARNLNRYKELNFNAVHQYDEAGSGLYGNLIEPVLSIDQINNYKGFLDSIKNNGPLYGFFERSFLSKYCYGQRLIYEIPEHQNDETTNYGFVYSSSECGNHETDQGRTVIHAVPNTHNEGNLCYDIYENLQHTDLFNFRQNERGTWYIKPVMRIPVGMPDGIPVVRIDIFSFDSTLVRYITINTDNFYNTGSYEGDYIENYFRLNPSLEISGEDNSASLNKGRGLDTGWQNWNTRCHIDFRIHWFGRCEVWFDKMIVDDEIADYMFDPSNQAGINYRINQEITNFTNQGGLYTFFTDEVHISQVSCIKYVVDKMRQNNPPPRFSIAVTNNVDIMGLKHDLVGFKIYLDSIRPDFFQDDHHGIDQENPKIPYSIPTQSLDPKIPQSWIASSNYEYNQRLQNIILGSKDDSPVDNYVGSLLYEIQRVRDVLPTDKSIKFIMQPQIQGFIVPSGNGGYDWGNREPLNEEIQVQAMVSIAHGVDGLCWYEYNSFTGNRIQIGLLDPIDDTSKRTLNCYSQNKWQYVSDMNQKIKNWTPVLENSNWLDGYSVHQNTANHFFVEDIRSIYRDNSNIFTDDPPCINCDPIKYWEEGFFVPKDQSDKSEYVLMVNRRCVPDEPEGAGDVRFLKIKFKPDELQGFNNWKLNDVNTGQEITFDKNNQGIGGYLYLGYDKGNIGYFYPGEGKLFKLAPVMQGEGTLVCDEEIGSGISSFECKGEVISNGKNITIPNKITISFHPEGKITMNGGQFTCGQSLQNREIIFQGFSSFYWNGIEFNSCSNIDIRNSKFIKSPDVPPGSTDYIYSLKITNSNCVIINNCEFDYTNTELSGAVKIDFAHNFRPRTLYIANNDFNTGISTAPILNIMSYTSNSIPVLMEYNIFSAPESDSSNNAIILSNITGGAIKNNIFTNYLTSVKLLSTSLDFYSNTITCNRNNAIGINCIGNSFINMSTVNSLNLGGQNRVTNLNDGVQNISVSNSMFNIQNGYNYFNLTGIENGSFHLKGYFPRENYTPAIKAIFNCFNRNGNMADPVHQVTWGISDPPIPAVFYFNPSSCIPQTQTDLTVFELDNNIYDTVRTNNMSIQNTPLKMLYDSININVRKNDYQTVISQGYTFLNNYTDSVESVDIISKLYLASLVLDSSGSKIQPLMTYYESLIQNYSQETALISRAYYFIQKCKVALTDYQSALTGFQDIMNQNPYTYEGLLASWDYSATTLLVGGGGSFKEQLPLNETQLEVDENSDNEVFQSLITQILDSLRIDRKTIITNSTDINQNRIDNKKLIITKNIESVFEGNRKITENRIRDLEKKIRSGNEKIRKDAAKELLQMKKIGEVIKVRNPKDIAEHIKFVNRDIKKVFGGSSSTSESKKANIIPTEYALYQNYRNPFNPVTKISFDLPKDSKVKLVIYDILGREITRLLNSEFRPAGKHVVEFNAVNLNLASGVYFYRIEAGDFVNVKKMVLIK